MLVRAVSGTLSLALAVPSAAPARPELTEGFSGHVRTFVGPTEVPWTRATVIRPHAPPSPKAVAAQRLEIAVGLAPEAPGSKHELALVKKLEATVLASRDPPTSVRRLRAGAGDARLVCRERRDDLVLQVGYIADRRTPVVLAHDCSIDEPLGIRSIEAVDEPALVAVFWDEHLDRVRRGARERRTWAAFGPKARAGVLAGPR